jgi:HK97 family phage major capsid protein
MRHVAGTGRQRIMGEIPEAIWTEACAKLNELALGFNDTEVDGYKVGGFFAVCNAILEDNDVNLMSEILNALGKAIGKAVDKAIVYGTGVKMPLGIVPRLAQTQKPTDYSATAREWKDLRESHILTGTGATGLKLLQEIVKNSAVAFNDYFDGGLVWLMNKKTHNTLKVESMEKNLNAAIVAGINNSMPVAGGDIIELSFIPEGEIVFGYLDAYLLAERAGTTLGQSEHVRFLEDQTVFKGTARYDGEPVIPEAFGVMSITAKAPTTSVTFTADAANAAAAS